MEVDRRINEAMEELVKGREFANQLGQVMKNDELVATTTTRSPLFAQHLVLVNNVLNSFTNTLSLLKLQRRKDFSFITSTSKSQDFSQDYKTRKITKTWEKVSESPTTDDGHEWRKYGQKTIINSKYSREYYRCTHKIDQRCQATKQVQRIKEKPPSYKTTYYDRHTCKSTDEIIFEPTSPPPHDPSIFLSFNNTFPTPTKQDCPFLSSLDCKEELVIPSPSLDDYLLTSPEPTLDNSISTSQVSSTLPSTFESDDDDHNDMMMVYGDLLYHSAELHHDFFHPFLGYIG